MGGTAIGTQKRDETPSSRNETPSSPHRPTTRLLLIAATTRLRPPDVRSANESSVAQADGASTTRSSTKPSTTKSSTTAQPQQLRRSPNSAAARTQRNPELQQ